MNARKSPSATQDSPAHAQGDVSPPFSAHYDYSFTLQTIMELQKSSGKLEAAIEANTAALLKLDAKIDASIGKLDAKIDASIGKLDAKIDASIGKLDAKIDKVSDKLEMRISSLESKVSAISHKVYAAVAVGSIALTVIGVALRFLFK